MSFGLARLAAFALALLFAGAAAAQPRDAVDCGNGYYCPAGNACLLAGLCAREVAEVPGSIRTSTGNWCEPGFREHRFTPGKCVPTSYSDCQNGTICPPGSTCSADGRGCDGGPEATGPPCGSVRCAKGRICSSNGNCMNTQYYHDCGNGTICTKAAACEHPSGCVFVAPQRTKQIKRNR